MLQPPFDIMIINQMEEVKSDLSQKMTSSQRSREECFLLT